MNTTYDKEADPVLSREDAIAILNTPDDQLQELLDRASALRHKYKGNRVSIHILTNARSGNCSLTAPSPAVPKQILININGSMRISYITIMTLSMSIICPDIASA